jgi:hypothetical protein
MREWATSIRKESPLAYTIIAEARDRRLLGDRFTADTPHEAFARVQHLRRRGFQVKITGPDGESVSENELEAKAAGSRSARAQPAPRGSADAGSE